MTRHSAVYNAQFHVTHRCRLVTNILFNASEPRPFDWPAPFSWLVQKDALPQPVRRVGVILWHLAFIQQRLSMALVTSSLPGWLFLDTCFCQTSWDQRELQLRNDGLSVSRSNTSWSDATRRLSYDCRWRRYGYANAPLTTGSSLFALVTLKGLNKLFSTLIRSMSSQPTVVCRTWRWT